jgi:hypothetical protein
MILQHIVLELKRFLLGTYSSYICSGILQRFIIYKRFIKFLPIFFNTFPGHESV